MSRDVPDMRQQRLAEASPVQVGEVVAGKYRIDEILAVGGMGVVALAEHEVLGQRVALKFLLESQQTDETTQRFLREARAAARIQSEHVVRVYDCGKLPSGVPYMVMEHLTGIELSKEMRRRRSFSPVDAVDIMLDALLGVAEAHAQGIVHRDIKPSNLFLVERSGRDRVVKVLDFGISKVQPGPHTKVDDEDLTQTSMVLGSPRYISPEQARSSKTVDGRADIWSLGVVLYQMLAGSPPFRGDTFGEILTNILLATPEPLVATRDDLPPELGDVVMCCLARDPDERYATVAELAAALAPHGSPSASAKAERVAAILGEPLPEPTTTSLRAPDTDVVADDATATRVTDSQAATEVVGQDESPTQGTWAQSQAEPVSRKRTGRLLAMGAVIALLVGAGIAYRTLAPGSEPSEPSPATAAETPSPSTADAEEEAPAPTAAATVEPTPTTTATTPPTTSASASAAPSPPPVTPVAPPPLPPPVTKPPPSPPPSGGVLDRSD